MDGRTKFQQPSVFWLSSSDWLMRATLHLIIGN